MFRLNRIDNFTYFKIGGIGRVITNSGVITTARVIGISCNNAASYLLTYLLKKNYLLGIYGYRLIEKCNIRFNYEV